MDWSFALDELPAVQFNKMISVFTCMTAHRDSPWNSSSAMLLDSMPWHPLLRKHLTQPILESTAMVVIDRIFFGLDARTLLGRD